MRTAREKRIGRGIDPGGRFAIELGSDEPGGDREHEITWAAGLRVAGVPSGGWVRLA